ncbi:MAG: dihydrolipoyl dehydrogenase [Deltaproteobacteria bacterium HGW-Deltaproteobacteria-14]|jgi:dihydrolipoamide dehydrogenase|nr:MAG: dihydrolipoyl dehydrogenase [Deltaproteobacteria bacterium HGW-Deltaproteobacteria-14]
MPETRYDVVVIGSGPGGYVCAIRCAQLGLKTACVERYPTRGGTCLNVGCIPSKALLESSERYHDALHGLEAHGVTSSSVSFDLDAMMQRKRAIVDQLTGGVATLLARNKIDSITGRGRLVSDGASHAVAVVAEDGSERRITADAVVIATGSKPTPLRGVDFDGDRIVDSTGALSFSEVPEHLVLIGAGVIGLELGSVWRRLGARVTVLEYLDRVLPGIDGEIAKQAKKVLARQGLEFSLGARVTGARVDGDAVTVTWLDAAGGEHAVVGDRVLCAVGRRPYTDGLGCVEAGVALDERGRIEVDGSFQTTAPGIFAIGDVIRGAMLAHKAEDEGIAVAEILAGGAGHVNYDAVPSIVYTHPEIAAVGRTEEELKAAGVPYTAGRFRYAANGRAMALGETDGLVKILAHAETDRVLGCHIIGARAGDLIAEAALAIELGASAEDVARSCHAHPTLAEVLREAALDVAKRAIHKA